MHLLDWRHSRIVLLAFVSSAFAQSTVQGIKNFYQVDSHVYRGAQPSNEGLQYLAKLGVKTVIDLREADRRSKAEKSVVTAAGMKYVNVPMTGLKAPTEAETSRILAILEDETAGPVFVHCKRGADRTGAVIAAYRIDHEGWDSTRALSEAMERGMSFFQLPRQSYISNFQPRVVDAKAAASKAGVPASDGAAAPAVAQ